MLYHRISTLIHITAETKIREDAHDRSMNRTLGVAEFLTNPLTSKSTKHELISDKKRNDLEMNRSVKMPEKEAEITSIGDIVDKQMVHLKAMTDKLDEKQQHIIQQWKRKSSKSSKLTMAEAALRALDAHKNQSTPNRGKTNKVEPQPSTSSDSSSGPPPNGQLQNQEPISGTDSNV